MGEHFIILGLPRSMTAWVSCFLTCGDVFCEHEIWSPDMAFEACEYLLETLFPVSGVCDPGFLADWKILKEEFPNAKFAWIERNFDECERSFRNATGIHGDAFEFFLSWATNKHEFLESVNPEIFTFDELQTEAGARRLWEYCAPHHPLPPAHLRKMLTLKVTVHPKVYTEAANLLNQLTAD